MSNINYINNTPITYTRVKNLLQGEEAAFIKSKSVSEYLFNTLMTIVARMPLLKKYATEWKADRQQAYQALNKIYQAAEKEIEQTYPSFHEWGSNLKELVRMHAILTKLDEQQNQLKSGDANNQEKFELRIDGDALGLFYGNECQYMLPAKEELKTIIRDELITPRYKKLEQAVENVFNSDIDDNDNQLEQAVENLFNPDTETKYKAFFEIRSQLKETSILPFTATNLNVKHAEKTFHIGPFKFAETNPYKSEESTLAYLHHQTERLNQDSPERNTFYNKLIEIITKDNEKVKNDLKTTYGDLTALSDETFLTQSFKDVIRQDLTLDGIYLRKSPKANEILNTFLMPLTVEQKCAIEAMANQTFLAKFCTHPSIISKYHNGGIAFDDACDKANCDTYGTMKTTKNVKKIALFTEQESNKIKIVWDVTMSVDKVELLNKKEGLEQFNGKVDFNKLYDLKQMCAYDDIKFNVTIMVDSDGSCEIADFNIKANPAVLSDSWTKTTDFNDF